MATYVQAPIAQPYAQSYAQPMLAAPMPMMQQPQQPMMAPTMQAPAYGYSVAGSRPASLAARPAYPRRPVAVRRPSRRAVRFSRNATPEQKRFFRFAASLPQDSYLNAYRDEMAAMNYTPGLDGFYRKWNLPHHLSGHRRRAKKLARAYRERLYALFVSGAGQVAMPVATVPVAMPAAQLGLLGDGIL